MLTFGSVASAVLGGNIRKLAAFFHVSPGLFL
jgi:hypothetical protein